MAHCSDCLHYEVCESYMMTVSFEVDDVCTNFQKQEEWEKIVRCGECVHDGFTSCPLCYIEQHTLEFVDHDSNFFCGNGERRCD